MAKRADRFVVEDNAYKKLGTRVTEAQARREKKFLDDGRMGGEIYELREVKPKKGR